MSTLLSTLLGLDKSPWSLDEPVSAEFCGGSVGEGEGDDVGRRHVGKRQQFGEPARYNLGLFRNRRTQ